MFLSKGGKNKPHSSIIVTVIFHAFASFFPFCSSHTWKVLPILLHCPSWRSSTCLSSSPSSQPPGARASLPGPRHSRGQFHALQQPWMQRPPRRIPQKGTPVQVGLLAMDKPSGFRVAENLLLLTQNQFEKCWLLAFVASPGGGSVVPCHFATLLFLLQFGEVLGLRAERLARL